MHARLDAGTVQILTRRGNELGELRLDPGRRRSGFTPSADRDHVGRGSGMGFRHSDIHREFLVLGRLADRLSDHGAKIAVPLAQSGGLCGASTAARNGAKSTPYDEIPYTS